MGSRKHFDFLNKFRIYFFKKMAKTENIRSLEVKAQEAEALVCELKDELQQLRNVVSALKTAGLNANPALVSEKLIQENALLKKEIERYKEQLTGRSSNTTANIVSKNDLVLNQPPLEQSAEKKVPLQEKKAKIEKPVKEKKEIVKDASANEEPPVDVGRLDFRVGKIVDVKKHPDADSLYVEQIDLGEGKARTIVSGLVKHVPIEEMVNRMVIVLCNLKPAKMRGVTSEGMVMCASADKVEVLIPPQGSVPGDIVEFEGFPRCPDSVLNPKKKIFETVAPDLKTDASGVATYKGVPWTVPGKGIVTAASLTGVNIK